MNKFGSAVILAGGKSQRMGFDKQLLKVNERRLMDTIICKLRQEFNEIIIVTNKPEYYNELVDKITKDIIPGKGPLSGIHSGLHAASSEYVYFIACDMPNINLEYIRYMKKNIGHRNVYAGVTRFGDWIEPFNAFYSRRLKDEISVHLANNKRSINSLLEKLKVHYISEREARKFSPNWDMFYNLNTKEDLNNFLSNIVNQ